MRSIFCWVAALGGLAVSHPTLAGPPAPGATGWTHGGMLGSGEQGFYATAGFPGLSAGYLRGLSDSLDVGGRLSYHYAGEGVVQLPGSGVKLAGDVRLRLDTGLPFELTLRALPGVDVYFSLPSGFSVIGVALPLEVEVGIPATPALLAHAGVRAPFSVGFWSGFGASFTSLDLPFLFGGGAEYRVDRTLSLHARVHMGPYAQAFLGGQTTTYLAFDAVLGITYRLSSPDLP